MTFLTEELNQIKQVIRNFSNTKFYASLLEAKKFYAELLI